MRGAETFLTEAWLSEKGVKFIIVRRFRGRRLIEDGVFMSLGNDALAYVGMFLED